MTERILMPAILWLALLPTEQFEKALKAAMDNKCGSYADTGNDCLIEVESLQQAICASFLWDDSEDGHKYWSDIVEDLSNNNG